MGSLRCFSIQLGSGHFGTYVWTLRIVSRVHGTPGQCCRQHVSCIANTIVASLFSVCRWIQRDTSRPWHKWIVIIMSPRCAVNIVPRISNLLPSNVCPSICIRIQVARPGNMLPLMQVVIGLLAASRKNEIPYFYRPMGLLKSANLNFAVTVRGLELNTHQFWHKPIRRG